MPLLLRLFALLAVIGLWSAVVLQVAVAGPTEVRQIQQMLTDAGYDPGPVDGAWGGRTERAAKQFLTEKNIDAATVFTFDGRDDDALLSHLLTASVSKPKPELPEVVRALVVPPVSSEFYSFSLSNDGSLAASGTGEAILVWDVKKGRLLKSISGHSKRGGWATAISPDGKLVASAIEDDKTITLWNVRTGKVVQKLRGYKGSATKIAISPGGKLIAAYDSYSNSSRYPRLRLWDVATARLLWASLPNGYSLDSIEFAPDGSSLLIAGQRLLPRLPIKYSVVLQLIESRTGKLIRSFRGHKIAGTSGGVNKAVFSNDGSRVASIGADHSVRVWEVATGRQLQRFTARIKSESDGEVTISADGRLVAATAKSEPEKIKIWDVETGRLVGTLKGSSELINLLFLPDRSEIVAVTSWRMEIWNARTRKLVKSIGHGDSRIFSVAHSPDGTRFVSGGAQLRVWDAISGNLVHSLSAHQGLVMSVAFSPNGTTIASGSEDKTIRLWNRETGELTNTLTGHEDAVKSIAFSPDGSLLVSGSEDKTLRLWDVKTGKLIRTMTGHAEGVRSVAFAPNGRQIVSCTFSEGIRIWDSSTGRTNKKLKARKSYCSAVGFSPDSSEILRAGSRSDDDGTKYEPILLVIDSKTGQTKRKFITDADSVSSAFYSADGSRILSAKHTNITVWGSRSQRPQLTFKGHGRAVTKARFSPNSNRLVSVSLDATSRIWDSETGALLATFIGSGQKDWITITPEGFFAGTRKGADLLSIARGLDLYSMDQFYQTLYRPDLVREKLAGDPDGKVRAAAAKIDLDKIIDSGGAPKITILSPGSGSSVTNDKVKVEANIADQGGGIGRIEWRVNGLTLGVHTKRGFERVANEAEDKKTVTVARDLWLKPGKNTIEVIAYNAKNLIASEPTRITIKWDGQTSKTPPRLHVLAVGINNYFDSRLKLNFAVPDAKAIGEVLIQAGAGLYESVTVTSVLDGDATAQGLESAFEDLARKVRPRDVFVFFLAGHGKTVDGRYYFIPQDFRYKNPQSIIDSGIGQDQWQRWLSRVPARKSILLYDTCESGSLTGTRIATRGMERVAALEKLTRAMGRTVLSAATDDAPALEGYRGHGVFTYALLDALNRSDANKNDLIEVTELAGHVDAHVPEISQEAFGQRQLPQMNIVGSNFPLAKRIAVLSDQLSEPKKPSVSTKPTHVVIRPSDLFAEAGGTGAVSEHLKPGTALTLVRTANGWTLVARDGKQIGFVQAANLARIR